MYVVRHTLPSLNCGTYLGLYICNPNGAWNAHTEDDKWLEWSDWVGEWKYGFYEHELVNLTGERQSLKTQYSNSKDTNPWRVEAKKWKATMNYAAHHKMQPSKASLDKIENHNWGIEGWASIGEPNVGGRPTVDKVVPKAAGSGP